jgi:hypothetical protein
MLLNEQEVQIEIANSLRECKNSIIILSAFIKHNAFEWFKEQIESIDIEVIVVARWRLDDLIAKVSDLSIYRQCQELGWTFKVDERLHSKLFLIDSSIAFIGSSNLTGAGLGLTEKSNFELSTKIEVTDIDIDKVHKYIDSCTTMTDGLYGQMKSIVDSVEFPKKMPQKWPLSIKSLLEQKVDYLWVDELLFTSPNSSNSDDIKHDLSLLELDSLDKDMDLLRVKFTELRIVKWLKSQLLKEETKSLRFGKISSLLHDALLNNPKPYRKEVKDFQVNLFNWLKYLNLNEFKIEKYNHSESIYLTSLLKDKKVKSNN